MSNNVPNNVNVFQDTPNQVLVNEQAPNLVVIRSGGGGGNTRRFVYEKPIVSSEWVITHTLGGFPSVTVVDSAGTQVIGEVKYDSTTQITVKFTAAFSGYAYLT